MADLLLDGHDGKVLLDGHLDVLRALDAADQLLEVEFVNAVSLEVFQLVS